MTPAPTYRLNSNGAYWQASWTDGSGRRRRRSIGRKRDLTRRQAEAEVQRIAIEHGIQPGLRHSARACLHDWLVRYLEVRSTALDPATMKAHRRTADLLRLFFPANPRIDEIPRGLATDWRAWLAADRGLGESTVCKHCRIAKVIIRHAIAEERAGTNPFDHLVGTAPRIEQWNRRLVSLGEANAVAAACPLAERLIMLGWYAGLRTSEAVHLRWDHLSDARLTVEPRSGVRTTKQRLRVVRVEPGLASCLERWAPRHLTVCGVLEAGKAGQVHRILAAACGRTRVEAFTMQDLRKTRDTLWHQQFPAHVACAWIGHSEQVARDHYLTVSEDYYRCTA
jgi:integrase